LLFFNVELEDLSQMIGIAQNVIMNINIQLGGENMMQLSIL